MGNLIRFPHILKEVLQRNPFENIIDSNIFSAYVHDDLPVPRIIDPRKTQHPPVGAARHPFFIRTMYIDQIFSYLGYIKRVKDEKLIGYLPVLNEELDLFFRVLVDIVARPDFLIPEEIYLEQKQGLKHFLQMYRERTDSQVDWIERIWAQQKHYLELVNRLLDHMKERQKVFDLTNDSFYRDIIASIELKLHQPGLSHKEGPSLTDISFVASCCAKARQDWGSKTIWSSDRDTELVLRAVYSQSDLVRRFPQVYLHTGYTPGSFKQIFPRDSRRAF
jgi:hypothetical protein